MLADFDFSLMHRGKAETKLSPAEDQHVTPGDGGAHIRVVAMAMAMALPATTVLLTIVTVNKISGDARISPTLIGCVLLFARCSRFDYRQAWPFKIFDSESKGYEVWRWSNK